MACSGCGNNKSNGKLTVYSQATQKQENTSTDVYMLPLQIEGDDKLYIPKPPPRIK